jgi:hypothetical protein
MGVVGSVQGSTTAGTTGTQPGSSQAGSSSGGCGGVGHNLQADPCSIRGDTPGDTSSSCTAPSQAMGSAKEESTSGHPAQGVVHSSSSSTTTTVEGLLLRPSIKDLVSLVCQCLLGLLFDPAVMGDAEVPAPWMPAPEYIVVFVIRCEGRVQGCLERAADASLS